VHELRGVLDGHILGVDLAPLLAREAGHALRVGVDVLPVEAMLAAADDRDAGELQLEVDLARQE
jgi:hypothetical protein